METGIDTGSSSGCTRCTKLLLLWLLCLLLLLLLLLLVLVLLLYNWQLYLLPLWLRDRVADVHELLLLVHLMLVLIL